MWAKSQGRAAVLRHSLASTSGSKVELVSKFLQQPSNKILACALRPRYSQLHYNSFKLLGLAKAPPVPKISFLEPVEKKKVLALSTAVVEKGNLASLWEFFSKLPRTLAEYFGMLRRMFTYGAVFAPFAVGYPIMYDTLV